MLGGHVSAAHSGLSVPLGQWIVMPYSLVKRQLGFTLVEISIVLLIISLLLGAILVPLGSAFEESQRSGVKRQLEEMLYQLRMVFVEASK